VSQLPRPLPRPKAKIVVRDLDRGVPVSANYSHSSYRLKEEKVLLRKLAKKKYGGITMSAVLRILIREEAKREGIE
jgi:hypothetical protein